MFANADSVINNTDAGILLQLQGYRKYVWFLKYFTSSHPLLDISFYFIVLSAILNTYYLNGWSSFWLFAYTLVLTVILRYLFASCKSPGSVNSSINPYGRLSPSAFPCVELIFISELLMEVALSCEDCSSSSYLLGSILFQFFFIISLRCFTETHFLYQIILSIIVGFTSYASGMALGSLFLPTEIKHQFHSLSAIGVGSVFLAFLALRIENNEAPIGRVEKKEFMKILKRIVLSNDVGGVSPRAKKKRLEALEQDLEIDNSSDDSDSAPSSRIQFKSGRVQAAFFPTGTKGGVDDEDEEEFEDGDEATDKDLLPEREKMLSPALGSSRRRRKKKVTFQIEPTFTPRPPSTPPPPMSWIPEVVVNSDEEVDVPPRDSMYYLLRAASRTTTSEQNGKSESSKT
jgi:hypothetical protein